MDLQKCDIGDENPISSAEELQIFKVRKPYTITKQRERWSEEEHIKFLDALRLYGRAWRRIEEHIGTKTAVQIRSHAQKFFSKISRDSSRYPIEIPPPRPKRKPIHPYPRKSNAEQSRTHAPPPELIEKKQEPLLPTISSEISSPKSVLSRASEATNTETDLHGCHEPQAPLFLKLFGNTVVVEDVKKPPMEPQNRPQQIYFFPFNSDSSITSSESWWGFLKNNQLESSPPINLNNPTQKQSSSPSGSKAESCAGESGEAQEQRFITSTKEIRNQIPSQRSAFTSVRCSSSRRGFAPYKRCAAVAAAKRSEIDLDGGNENFPVQSWFGWGN